MYIYNDVYAYTSLCVYIYIYIYIYASLMRRTRVAYMCTGPDGVAAWVRHPLPNMGDVWWDESLAESNQKL